MQSSSASQSRALCLWLAVHTSLDRNVHLCLWCGQGPGSGRVDVLALHCESLPASCSPKEAQAGGRLAGFLVSASSVAVGGKGCVSRRVLLGNAQMMHYLLLALAAVQWEEQGDMQSPLELVRCAWPLACAEQQKMLVYASTFAVWSPCHQRGVYSC